LIGRYGALLPLFRLVGVPCIAAFRRVKSLLRHHSDRPKLANSFRRCDLFDWRFFGFGFFAMLIRGVQEPSDEAGAALLHYRRILGLLLIVEEPVIFRVAHGILHLLSAPNIKQLRNTVYCSRVAGILDRNFFWALQAKLKAQRNNRTAKRQIRVLAVWWNLWQPSQPHEPCHKLARELPGQFGDPYQGDVT